MVCCRFYLTAAPFVANLSGAVRARDVMVNGMRKGRPVGGLLLFSWFTCIRALPSYSSVIVAIAGLRAAAGFRDDYVRIEWSSIRHVFDSSKW